MIKIPQPSVMNFERMLMSIICFWISTLDYLSKTSTPRKKINQGTLEEWKRVMFEEIANSRDLSIQTGGRKKIK